MKDPLSPTPAFLLFKEFPYLAEKIEFAENITVAQHVHFQKALERIKDDDILRLVHLYGLMSETKPIVQSIGPFLLNRLKDEYSHFEKLINYVQALVDDDSKHYDLEHEAMKQLSDVQAATRCCIRFLRNVVKHESFIDNEIKDLSVTFSSGPLWANFYPKMRELYLEMDEDWHYFHPVNN
ncbi:MAG: hypothetical protein CFH44_00345 [Proteobacteria bacterium]|nr:MAG: hypothetical protein CFH44_00345 [Pseudomonadota bacterium]